MSEARTVFLDRDGTLNKEIGFFGTPDRLELLPGAADAVRRLHEHGYRIVITTNQSGIARGLYSEQDLTRVHEHLHALLDRLPLAYLHCPHHPEGKNGYGRVCACRKPKSGLLVEARELLGVALEDSVVIGDSARDLLMAHNLATDESITKVLVRSGKPIEEQREKLREANCAPDHEAHDLAAAVDWLLQR